jgi:hypothetical protein
VVFYIDDLNPEVIAKIVEIQNANPDGDFRTQVDEYLANEDRCSPDEREFVLEQIDSYIKLSKASAEEVNNATPQQPAHQGPSETPDSTGGNTAGAGIGTDGGAKQNEKPAGQTGGRGSRTGNTGGRTGGSTTRTSSNRTESAEELIKSLEDKIALIKLLDGVKPVEIPAGLNKTAREIMIDLQREHQTMIAGFMERVKNM